MTHESELPGANGPESPQRDKDLFALFHRTAPEVSSVEIRDLLSRRQSGGENRRREHSDRSHWSQLRRIKVVAAAAASAFLAASILWLLPSVISANVAFADVKDEIRRANTVQYRETRTDENNPQPRISKVFIQGRYLHRTERIGVRGEVENIGIQNAETGTLVSIDPQRKRFVILEKQVSILSDGPTKERDIEPMPEAQFYASIRELPGNEAERLEGVRVIDNKKAVGFRLKEEDDWGTWTRTFWVDPDTKLPLRIEISYRSPRKDLVGSDWIQSDFVWNAELDPSLFSTKPPEGYAVEKQNLYGLVPEKTPDQE